MKIEFEGLSIPILLTVILTALKLAGVISWSWIWVLCPLWIPIGIVVGFYLLLLIMFIPMIIFYFIIAIIITIPTFIYTLIQSRKEDIKKRKEVIEKKCTKHT